MPLPVELQVLQLLAGTAGVLDDLPIPDVQPFIRDLADHFVANQATLVSERRTKGTLKADGLRERLLEAIKQFKSSWKSN
jgi:F-type H+-transporting ATPase subunit alpha